MSVTLRVTRGAELEVQQSSGSFPFYQRLFGGAVREDQTRTPADGGSLGEIPPLHTRDANARRDRCYNEAGVGAVSSRVCRGVHAYSLIILSFEGWREETR